MDIDVSLLLPDGTSPANDRHQVTSFGAVTNGMS